MLFNMESRHAGSKGGIENCNSLGVASFRFGLNLGNLDVLQISKKSEIESDSFQACKLN